MERKLNRPQADRYREPVKAMLDKILVLGRTPDGLWYDSYNPRSGSSKQRISDNWGYLLNAFRAFDQAEGTEAYTAEIARTMRAAAALKSFTWERNMPDGFADAIESMLYQLASFNVPECRDWVDDEIEIMFAKQDQSGFVQGGYLDGNFIRTALLYALYKSRGVVAVPWRPDLQIGAAVETNSARLIVHVNASAPWTGVLRFESPRHHDIWNMPQNYARLNALPEWSVIDNGRNYSAKDLDTGRETVLRGNALTEGFPVQIDGLTPRKIAVVPVP